MRHPWDCGHPSYVLRKRALPNGLIQIGNQCLTCGGLVGQLVKHERAPNPSQLPDWDREIQPLWEASEKRYQLQYREAQSREQGVATFSESRVDHDVKRQRMFWARYSEYLSSPEWHSKRAKVLERAHGVCEGCGLRPATQAHHLTYARIGREMLFDLVAVCGICHDEIHGEL